MGIEVEWLNWWPVMDLALKYLEDCFGLELKMNVLMINLNYRSSVILSHSRMTWNLKNVNKLTVWDVYP